jgi:Fe-S oxidoreductase
VEFDENGIESICCGAGGGLKNNHPEIANAAAKKRQTEIKLKGAQALVSTCPMCYKHFKENLDIPVYELSELLIKELDSELGSKQEEK